MVIAHSALVLLYFLSLDRVFLDRGLDPRLALSCNRYRHDARIGEVARAGLLVVVGIVCLIAIFIELWLSVFAAAVAILIVLRLRSATGADARRRFVFIELIVPAGAIVLPALFIGSGQWGTQLETSRGEHLASTAVHDGVGVMGADIVGSAITVSIMFSTFILLCLLRDEHADRSAGLRTTVTKLGREVSVLYALGLVALSMAMSVFGVGAEWWGSAGWVVGAVVAVAGLAVVWSLANRDDGRAAGVWIIASMLASVLMARGLIGDGDGAEPTLEEALSQPVQIEQAPGPISPTLPDDHD